MQIAVCDDEKIYQTAITQAIELWCKKRSISSIFVQCFYSSEELLNVMDSRQRFDIIFLDIQIPNEMSGLELAKQLRIINEHTQIVFVTNYVEYARDGYHVNALRYLYKPVHPDQVAECLDIAYRQWTIMQGESIALYDNRGKIVLRYKNILYVEAKGHSLMIYQADTSEPLIIKTTLDRIHSLLPNELFVKCHRSFIVNILYVRRITRDVVTMADGLEIAVGKHYRNMLGAAFDLYYRGIRI